MYKLKICLVSSSWVPIVPGKGVLHGGGIETQVYGLAKALAPLCDEVHLITPSTKLPSSESIQGITYHNVFLPSEQPTSESIRKLTYCDIAFAVKSRRLHQRLNPDIVHCNTKFPAAAALVKRARQPVVFTAHNWKLWEGMKPEWKNRLARVAFELDIRLEKFIAQNSNKVLAISKAMKKGIVATTGVSSDRVEVVPNAVDAEVFYPQTMSRQPVILYVGRITAEKGIDVLVRAMPVVLNDVPDASLIIVGPRKYGFERGGFEVELRRLVRKLGLEQHVLFAGSVSIDNLRILYSEASVFCLPSVWQEPFGLTLIEAMACETPVVGTSVGGIPEIILPSRSGLLVKPSNAKELAGAIVRILSDQKFAKNLGRNGRKAVEERYTFDRLAKEVISIYSDLLS